MTKVFVVTNGSYSDYRVVGIYSSRANADLAATHFLDDVGVEEYELDAAIDEMRQDRKPYFVRLSRETGGCLDVRVNDSAYGAFSTAVGEDVHKALYTHCWADNSAHAIKIASERRRAFLALPTSEDSE
jgi:hypothetical protein